MTDPEIIDRLVNIENDVEFLKECNEIFDDIVCLKENVVWEKRMQKYFPNYVELVEKTGLKTSTVYAIVSLYTNYLKAPTDEVYLAFLGPVSNLKEEQIVQILRMLDTETILRVQKDLGINVFSKTELQIQELFKNNNESELIKEYWFTSKDMDPEWRHQFVLAYAKKYTLDGNIFLTDMKNLQLDMRNEKIQKDVYFEVYQTISDRLTDDQKINFLREYVKYRDWEIVVFCALSDLGQGYKATFDALAVIEPKYFIQFYAHCLRNKRFYPVVMNIQLTMNIPLSTDDMIELLPTNEFIAGYILSKGYTQKTMDNLLPEMLQILPVMYDLLCLAIFYRKFDTDKLLKFVRASDLYKKFTEKSALTMTKIENLLSYYSKNEETK